MIDNLFGSSDTPTPNSVWELYERGQNFNDRISLDDTVKTNENFFIGRQWEGVRSNGLPTPVFNILKRDVCFVVSTITSSNLKVRVTPLSATPCTESLEEPARILSEEFESIFDQNNVTGLSRELSRDAAVRGDGCLYTFWDNGIKTEVIENTRVYFGNPNDRHVESQPYIIIESRDMARSVRREAMENNSPDWDSIVPDSFSAKTTAEKYTDDKVTKLLILWRDDETGEIWGFKCSHGCVVKEPWNLGIRLYPIVWLNWDYVQDCYHGQSMITGLIPNQIFINKIWAMSMLSLMTSAYPKVVYDRTRIPKWTNQIGQAIGVNGGDVSSAAKTIDPAQISPQIAQFIELAINETNRNLGANSAALGDVRPENTSAIIALQKAAATPSEITKQNLYRCIEDLARIYLEFIAEYYGVRKIDAAPSEKMKMVCEFAGKPVPDKILTEYDFSAFKKLPMAMKLEVGASSYYSEIAAIQTLDNLLASGKIDIVQYLERVPDGYIPDRGGLISSITNRIAGK